MTVLDNLSVTQIEPHGSVVFSILGPTGFEPVTKALFSNSI